MTQIPTGLVASTPFDLVQQSAKQQRANPRFPFSAPLEAINPDGTTRHIFCRDISADGIGLLTKGDIEPDMITVRVPVAFGTSLEIQAQPGWSHPIGSGWYMSGARFIGSTQRDRIHLWLTRRLQSLRRRASHRYPFYRPVMICYGLRDTEPTEAFARDISTGGMGLIHELPIGSDVAFVTVGDEDRMLEFRMKNAWTRRCDSGLFISGWSFHPRTRVMEQLDWT